MKEYKKTLLAAVIVCLLPLLLSAAVYSDLPEQIAIHWDSAGNPDGYAGRLAGAFGIPVFLAVLEVICVAATVHDPKKQNQSAVSRALIFWLIPILSLVVQPVILLVALGRDINVTLVVTLLVGVILILSGNYLPKSRQNYTIGIKVPWTLADADNWNKTHRLGGILFILCGLFIIASNFLPMSAGARTITMVCVTLGAAVVPVVYSFALYVKGNK